MLQGKKIKPLYACLWIALSVVVFTGIPVFLLKFQSLRHKLYKDETRYHIQTLLQKGPIKEALKSRHLTEILDLSSDQPQNLFAYDLKRGEELLVGSGIIASAKLSRLPPNTLEVDYEVREPIAYLEDYTNTVLDQNGVIFPLSPYFTPKILPKIYMGISIEPFIYGKIEDKKMDKALKVLRLVSQMNPHKNLFIDSIDVSKINEESLGRQEIVLTFYETIADASYIRYLRLSKDNYEEEFIHFLNLKAMNLPKDLVVDLRMFPNAYLTPLELK